MKMNTSEDCIGSSSMLLYVSRNSALQGGSGSTKLFLRYDENTLKPCAFGDEYMNLIILCSDSEKKYSSKVLINQNTLELFCKFSKNTLKSE